MRKRLPLVRMGNLRVTYEQALFRLTMRLLYQVEAFGRADTVTIRTVTDTSTHTVHEHAAPTHKERVDPTQQEQGVHPLHPTCVSGQYTVAIGSLFVPLSITRRRATWPCDKRPEVPSAPSFYSHYL
ncbi:unnamed protein product [Heligmosomoides polygyrus]|uniref:Uncharacterized protein n=1 Tax=Heligmosomoides polygyrus TaxID=6339 RepID=A0A183FR93_HELPZ|nr:unnamed protein product [Heligmosomoides polygyrus]